jgi:hypothetical protein
MNENRINRRQFAAVAVTGTAASLLGLSSAAAADATPPAIGMIAESAIDDEGLNFVQGPWGTCINGQTFQEHAVATHRGYHTLDRGGKLHIAAATAKSQWTDWRVVTTSDRDYVGEPRVDVLRWRDERVLSVYVQQKPDLPGNPSPLRLIDFRR